MACGISIPAHASLIDPYGLVAYAGILQTQSESQAAVGELNALTNRITTVIDNIVNAPTLNSAVISLTNTVQPYVSPAPPTRPTISTTFPSPNAMLTVTPSFPQLGQLLALNPSFGTAPANPNITFNTPAQFPTVSVNPSYPAAPPQPVTGNVATLVLDPVPVLTAAEPVINSVTPPTQFDGAVPVASTLPTHNMPLVPSYNIPLAPVLRTLTLPATPTILDVTFDGVIPPPLDAPPDVSFNWAEQQYVSALNDVVKTKLIDLVQNIRQTGLNPVIEQQIWDRGRERTTAATRDNVINIQRAYSRAGHDMAQGDEAQQVFKALELQRTQDISESRNIAVAQADLEQKNFQFAVSQSLTYEGQMINLHNNIQQRAYEAARYAIEAAISIFQAKVTYYNAQVGLYQTLAQVYATRIQAELNKLELYKSQLEAQRLISDLNRQDIENYKAQIEAVVAIFDLYKTQLEAVRVELEQDKLTLEQFESQIRVYSAQIQAKAVEFDGYKSQLQGEQIKADIYNSLVNAFGKRTDAFVASTDARVKKLDSDIKIQIDTPIKIAELRNAIFQAQTEAETARIQGLNQINEISSRLFTALVEAEKARVESQTTVYATNVEAFKSINEAEKARLESLNASNKNTVDILQTQTEAETARMDALSKVNLTNTEAYKASVQAVVAQITGQTTVYQTDAQVFGSLVQSEGTRIDAQVKVQAQEMEVQVKSAELQVAVFAENIKRFLGQRELVLGSLKALAQVQAQLAAAFGSAVNYGAAVHSSTTHGENWNVLHQASLSDSGSCD